MLPESSYLQSINRESIIPIKPSYTYLKKEREKKNGISKSSSDNSIAESRANTNISIVCSVCRLTPQVCLQHYVHPNSQRFIRKPKLHTRFIAFKYSFWPMAKLLLLLRTQLTSLSNSRRKRVPLAMFTGTLPYSLPSRADRG